jgi:transcriptional regulator with XRE-family HTH domain
VYKKTENIEKINIKKAVRTAMAMNDFNQGTLAEKIGVDKSTMSMYLSKSRNISLRRLADIAAACDIKLSRLIELAE